MNEKRSSRTRQAGNTSEFIADSLREAIFQGEYKVKQPLRQDQIAKKLNVSKIPLREALVQLKSEGLVEFMPNRGAVVSGLSPAEIKEIFLMRIVLENLAIEHAIPLIPLRDIIRAQSVLEIIDNENDKRQWSDLNWEFHKTLYQSSQMTLVVSTVHTLHNNVSRFLLIYYDTLSGSDVSQKDHWDLLAAFKEKDIPNAQKILTRHLSTAERKLQNFLS